MTGYIAAEKYIVKELLRCGVGVPISFEKRIAIEESYKPKNLNSYKQYFEISVPERNLYLEMDRAIQNQNEEVLKCLSNPGFIMPLFITQAKRQMQEFESKVVEGVDKDIQLANFFEDFKEEHFNELLKFNSGYELLDFINKKCVTHNMAISTALLYSSGIMGALYSDNKGERVLIYNAHDDIKIDDILHN